MITKTEPFNLYYESNHENPTSPLYGLSGADLYVLRAVYYQGYADAWATMMETVGKIDEKGKMN